jgi:hypothetical protein
VTSVAQYSDSFAAFQAAASVLSGGDQKPILKFEKGDWYAGQDKREVPNGTKLAADIVHAEWGWVRWSDGKPVERRMVPIAAGQPFAVRDSLGHNDKQLWETDTGGKPRDPWQFMIEIPVRELTGQRAEMVMSGGSKGWEGCCKALFVAFGEQMRANAGKVPIIQLGGDRYQHPTYGIVKTPKLDLVEWKSEGDLDAAAPAKGKAAKF